MRDLPESQLQQLKDALVHNRTQIIEKGLKRRRELSTGSDGTLQMPDDNDVATHLYGELLAVRLHDRERRLLRKLDAALARLTSGEYGYCEICDEFIGLARLKARPTATFCIECKEEQEREEHNRGETRRRPPDRRRPGKHSDRPQKPVRSPRRVGFDPGPWLSEEDLRMLSIIRAGEDLADASMKPSIEAEDVS